MYYIQNIYIGVILILGIIKHFPKIHYECEVD